MEKDHSSQPIVEYNMDEMSIQMLIRKMNQVIGTEKVTRLMIYQTQTSANKHSTRMKINFLFN